MNVPSPQNHATSSARTLRGLTSAPVLGATSCKRMERRAKVREASPALLTLVSPSLRVQIQRVSDPSTCTALVKAHLPSDHLIIHRKFYQRTHGRRQGELKPT